MSLSKSCNRLIPAVTAVLMCVAVSFAQIEQGSLKLSGFVSMESGQLVKYKVNSMDFLHQWVQKNKIGINFISDINERLGVYVTTGGIISYNTIPSSAIGRPDDFANSTFVGLFIDRAEMVLRLGPDPEEGLLDIGIGIWNEKYNHEAKNLGEYLFRSGAYPGYIYQSGFDECFYNLAGIHINNQLFGVWHNELFLTSELYLTPFCDFSIGYVTDISLAKKVINFGAGAQLFRLFSVDEEQTTPQALIGDPSIELFTQPNFYRDSIGVDGLGLPIYDTIYYTFAGTKVMARAMLDPKPLFGLDIFGAEDLKIYFEAAILGLKNYPNSPLEHRSIPVGKWINKFGFDTLLQKMPIMMGFNFPAFKILDLVSLQLEYYGKKYVNAVPLPCGSRKGKYYPVSTIPYNPGGGSVYDSLYEQGGAVNWKWSVYVQKTIFDNFSITAQAARDHLLNTVRGLSMLEVDREEALVQNKHWYWMIKFSGNF
ncbi:MAG: hypothetical protein JW863_23975 [Chitinispirillaceae bacterium]|nr:hypothetical protein [Chitinispirillaceae bacterium]